MNRKYLVLGAIAMALLIVPRRSSPKADGETLAKDKATENRSKK